MAGRPAVAVVSVRLLCPMGRGRRLSGLTRTRVLAADDSRFLVLPCPLYCSPARASLFSREGGSPVWVPAFAGKRGWLADGGGRLFGGGALPRGARVRGHAPSRPSPEGEGVFVLRCHRHHRIIASSPSCSPGSSRNASLSSRRRGSIFSGAGDPRARPVSLGSRFRGNDDRWSGHGWAVRTPQPSS